MRKPYPTDVSDAEWAILLPLPDRQVDRAFAWLVKCRCLSVDHEERARGSVAWIRAAMVRLMTKELAKAT